jgi:hypothetical protein
VPVRSEISGELVKVLIGSESFDTPKRTKLSDCIKSTVAGLLGRQHTSPVLLQQLYWLPPMLLITSSIHLKLGLFPLLPFLVTSFAASVTRIPLQQRSFTFANGTANVTAIQQHIDDVHS